MSLNTSTGNNKFNIPEGIIELPLKPFKVSNAKNILIISDTHFPYHDKKALTTAINYKDNIDTIILLGDMMDFYSLSSFAKNPNLPGIRDELKICREFLTYLRSKFRNAQIIYYEGNHEIRLARYIFQHAPAIAGLETMLFKTELDFHNLSIQFVENGTCLKVGSLHLLHGNEAGCRGGINIARTMLLKTNDNCAFGNFHKTQSHSGRDLDGGEFVNFAIGCLCGLKPRYLPINQWNLGFATVDLYKNEFDFQNKRILANYNVRSN
jgi:predicted phosphodiesterase